MECSFERVQFSYTELSVKWVEHLNCLYVHERFDCQSLASRRIGELRFENSVVFLLILRHHVCVPIVLAMFVQY